MTTPEGRIGRPPTCTCGECRKCKQREHARKWYRQMSPEEKRAYIARRNPSQVRQSDRDRYRRNPDLRMAQAEAREALKRRATKMVNIRVERGTMQKPSACEGCGREGVKLTAHHEDYHQPLIVTWLCYPCHGKRHRKPDGEMVTTEATLT